MKNILNPICQRLWRVRVESGLTDVQIVKVSKKSHAWWHRLKHSDHIPFDSSIETIAENMGVSSDWIRTGAGTEPDWKQFKIDTQLRFEVANKNYRNVIREMRQSGIQVADGTMAVYSADKVLPIQTRPEFWKAVDYLAGVLGVTRGKVLDKVDEIRAEKASGEQKKPGDAS
jgi:hypothetical protein